MATRCVGVRIGTSLTLLGILGFGVLDSFPASLHSLRPGHRVTAAGPAAAAPAVADDSLSGDSPPAGTELIGGNF